MKPSFSRTGPLPAGFVDTPQACPACGAQMQVSNDPERISALHPEKNLRPGDEVTLHQCTRCSYQQLTFKPLTL